MTLPDNHKRALSSSLYLVEKLLTEMEEVILDQNYACCSEVIKDIDTDIATLIEITSKINY